MINKYKLFFIPVVKYASFSHQGRTFITNLLRFNIRFRSGIKKYETGITSVLFLSPHVFTTLEFDTNHFDILFFKKTIKPKCSKSINQSDIIFSCPKIFVVLICDNCNCTSEILKHAVTWKLLFRRKSTFLSKFALSEAINWQLLKFLYLRL